MRILVTNDDGINAPGIWALVEAIADLGQVSVVAPDRDQSGVGMARTLLNILRVSEVESKMEGVTAHSVSGTPSDCVILGDGSLFPEKFDLVISGINDGANLGLDVLDSGTVGGALRGYFRGIPSIAVSVADIRNLNYDVAAQVARNLALRIAESDDDAPVMYNLNVPNAPAERIKGVSQTFLGPKAYLETIERGNDGRRTHYWIKHNRPTGSHAPEGCDVWAVRNGLVSVTPMDPSFVSGESVRRFPDLAEDLERRTGLNGAN